MAEEQAPPLTLGTAGHIDHGKTVLVRALTGVDTDRLPEEQQRGISIELGYAQLDLPPGRALSVIDVPGHERFVRTMVAGATGIDLFLLVVAADDGVMPQTREHLSVIRMLGVPAGVVALTKVDLVDADATAVVTDRLDELLAETGYGGTEIVPVCAPNGEGLTKLVAALGAIARSAPGRADQEGDPRLHVDRSFTLKGIGTVVTGTLWSGALRAGQEVRIEPSQKEARIRGLEVHGSRRESAAAGQRVAVNLVGVDRREVQRGDVVTSPAAELRPTYRLHASVELLPGGRSLERGARVQLHHGTRDTAARIYPLDQDLPAPGTPTRAQLRLERPIVPAAGDRFVLRRIAPADTIGGGVVIDPAPRKDDATPSVPRPPRKTRARSAIVADDPRLTRLAEVLKADGLEPRSPEAVAAALDVYGGDIRALLDRANADGLLVRVKPGLYYHPEALDGARQAVVAICERQGAVTIAGLRDELGTSRKYAQALLEHFDNRHLTRRVGDEHVLRRRATV